MNKWITLGKFGLRVSNLLGQKNAFTSKTVWNGFGQKLAVVLATVFGLDMEVSTQIGVVAMAGIGLGIDIWVRMRTKQSFGEPLGKAGKKLPVSSVANADARRANGGGYDPLDD